MQKHEEKKLELLAPAGAWESMCAAVQNGADAIYLGGSAFNARRFAGNFHDDEMRRALDYCHERGVRVYVTFNTLLLDRELKEALEYAAFLYEAGADALIVQDLGLVRMLKSTMPDFELHASTQMGIHDERGLAMCASLGIARTVLARELSLARIRTLHDKKSGVQLECFVHGALCTAVSGACLFSSLAGGRSGNRGACAQPCRKRYSLDGGAYAYPLSLMDLCMLDRVHELREAGIGCVKLEGRMKRAEYVAAMTRAYRLAINNAPRADIERALSLSRSVFSRGQCAGYYDGRDVPAGARGILEAPPDVCAQIKKSYGAEQRKRGIELRLLLEVGEPAVLELHLGDALVRVLGDVPEFAQKQPDTSRYTAQLCKLGDTPFEAGQCEIHMAAPAHLPVSALNALRRKGVEALLAALHMHRDALTALCVPTAAYADSLSGEILCIVPDVCRAAAAFEAGAHAVALAPGHYGTAKDMLLALQAFRARGKLLLQLTAADPVGEFAPMWSDLFRSGLLDGGVAQNVAQASLIEGERYAGYLCNAANAQAVNALYELGFHHVMLCAELNKAQMRDLVKSCGAGIAVYGRMQLMQLWHCPVRAASGCGECDTRQPSVLTDEEGRSFSLDTVRGEIGCLNRVRNCEVLDILDVLSELPKPSFIALEFTDETEESVRERVQAALLAMKGATPTRRGGTRGHYNRGWE